MAKFRFVIWAIALLSFVLTSCSGDKKQSPAPTSGKTIINELGEADANEKEKWFADLHRAAPDTDWKAIEASTQLSKHRQRNFQRSGAGTRSTNCSVEAYANGEIMGQWCERGSTNQAGSVGPMYYDAATDMLYTISAGGTIWKGLSDGTNWEPLNDDLKFSWNILERIPISGGNRWLAVMNKIVYYSDDDCVTWTAATGLQTYDNWGSRDKTIALGDAQNSIYMLMSEWDPVDWRAEVNIYKSVNNGVSFTKDLEFGPISLGDIDMINPYNSNDLYVLHRVSNTELNTYKLNASTGNIELENTNTSINFPDLGNLTGVVESGTMHLYTYSNNKVYYSSDEGVNWALKGNLPASPWSVGINVSAFDHTKLFMGEVECYRSYDSGTSWTKINTWGQYYGNPLIYLHADIMRIQFFEKSDNTEFMMISNHGGISVSYDHGLNNTNIAMEGLNVSQYYSVATDPIDYSHIYAGAQDQGFQRGADTATVCIQDLDQAISGDYGHIVFNDDGGLWTVYPGGWVSYWANPETAGITKSYTLESDNEGAWIPFLMESPYAGEQAIFMVGGNANGGAGSYIIKLAYDSAADVITATNHSSFDFYNASGTVLSAIDVSPIDDRFWYAATANGKFYYSSDSGESWTETASFNGPGQHYLYGATILASNTNTNTVYFGGSGYSNPPVYKSIDGGVTFTAMNTGLPSTMVFKLVTNPTETHIFAATEAGPYAYSLNTESWYDISGVCAPVQTYWSVEYLAGPQIVRYGTYGRGIWDFGITEPLPVELISFNACAVNKNLVTLDWSTASEIDNSHFLIERSSDGQKFETIEQVRSKGDAMAQQNYISSDRNPLMGVSYYRLKQVDYDGQFAYSKTAVVEIKDAAEVAVYPNPIANNQLLNISGAWSGAAEFSIYDATGLLVKREKISTRAEVNLSGLVPGNYFYLVDFGYGVKRGQLQVL